MKKLDGASCFLQSLATTRGGEVILGGDQDGVLRAWDVATAKVVAEFKP